MWHNKAMYKEKIEAMATKFSEKFAIIMLKKHRKFCRRGLTHLDATPIFKNRSDTYETPCMHAYIHGYVVDSDQVRVYYTVCSNPNQVKAKSKQ